MWCLRGALNELVVHVSYCSSEQLYRSSRTSLFSPELPSGVLANFLRRI